MRVWMKGAALLGCCVLAVLVFVAPHGQDRPRGEIVCAPLIGQSPSRSYISPADDHPDKWESEESTEPYDLDQARIICELRRSTRLAWAVLVAVPTTALLGAWVSTATHNH
jgi:hypothetical protein